MNDKELDKLLSFDALADAEQKTGQSYKTSKFTEALGFLSHIEHTAKKHNILAQLDDTSMATSLPNYLRVIADIGFETVYHESFYCDKYGYTDYQYIMWFNGILLNFDTYNGDVNSGSFYYNWKYNVEDYWRYTSSGHTNKAGNVYVGYHDCREAIWFHIRRLQQNGLFLPNWIEQPHLWLVNYEDEHKICDKYKDDCTKKSKAFDEITQRKIGMLPQFVQEAIGGNNS